jgi:hypothetical protein
MLTRYLYIKDEVSHSLILSLFDKHEDESLFWAYELYFSGFQLDVFTILNTLFEMYYHEKNPELGTYLNSLIIEWDDFKENHDILGKIITIMLNHSISLTELLRSNPKKYIQEGDEGEEEEDEIVWEDHWGDVEFEKEGNSIEVDFLPFRTKEKNEIKGSFLETVCRYPIRRYYCNMVIQPVIRENISSEFWLYYASFTPLWKERIQKYDGFINHTNKQVTFTNEDKEECFYELFDYEIDEQSIELKEQLFSKDTKKYTKISWKEFYDYYGYESVFRKCII